MPDWVVAVCRFGKESAVCDDLATDGFTCYMPKYRERLRHHGRKIWVERLLLGRYLLVELNACWNNIRAALHVIEVLMADEQPLLAREAEVERIRRSEVKGYVPIGKQPRFILDQLVLITGGIFANHHAIYEGMSNQGRDFVRLDMLGQIARVELAPGCLIAA